MKKDCRKYKAWKEKGEKASKATEDKDNRKDLCLNINDKEHSRDSTT